MGSILFLSISPINITSAGGRISKKYIDKISCCHHIIHASIGDNEKFEQYNNNCDCYSFKKKNNIFNKMKRVIFRKLLQHHFINSSLLYKKCEMFFLNNNIEAIISISAPFLYADVGYLLSRKYKIPHYIVYNDPLVGNVNENKSFFRYNKNKEMKWLNNVEKIFIPLNYYEFYIFIYGKLMEKSIVLDIPCYPDYKLTCRYDNNDIFYGGTFNKKYRNPKKIFLFFKKLYQFNPNIMLNCYSNLNPAISKFKNMHFHTLLNANDYRDKIDNAFIVLIKDNDFGFQIPSKIFEMLGSEKKILYFTNNLCSPGSILMRKNKNVFIVDETKKIDEKIIKDFIKFCSSTCKKDKSNYLKMNNKLINKFYDCFSRSLSND